MQFSHIFSNEAFEPIVLAFSQDLWAKGFKINDIKELVDRVFQEDFAFGIHTVLPFRSVDELSLLKKNPDIRSENYAQVISGILNKIKVEHSKYKMIAFVEISFFENLDNAIGVSVSNKLERNNYFSFKEYVLEVLNSLLDVRTEYSKLDNKSSLCEEMDLDENVLSVNIKISPNLLYEKFQDTSSSKLEVGLLCLLVDIGIFIKEISGIEVSD